MNHNDFRRTSFYLFSQVGTNFVTDLYTLINTYQSLKFITDVLCVIKYNMQLCITKYSILDLRVGMNHSLSGVRKYFSWYIKKGMYISNVNSSR